MDKRKAENLRVKQSITNALFALMREKSLSDVQITELVGRAGVARASFIAITTPRRTCSSP